MQLDAEEDANVFYKPPVEPAARASGETKLSGETAVGSQSIGAADLVADEEDDD